MCIFQIENMVEGLVNEAFQFTNTSFLPEEAMTSLQEFVDADVQSINITGKRFWLKKLSNNLYTCLFINFGNKFQQAC